jgi:hypothetical protein
MRTIRIEDANGRPNRMFASKVARSTTTGGRDIPNTPLFSPGGSKKPPAPVPFAGFPRPGMLQPKLGVGGVSDSLEQEADRVANHVMQMPALGGSPRGSASHENTAATVDKDPALVDGVPSTVELGSLVEPSLPAMQPSFQSVIRRQWTDAPAGGATSAETPAFPSAWNKAEASVAGVRRIPVEDIPGGNTSKDPQSAAKEAADSRAIAVLPASLDTTQPVDVLLHLHGHNVGYRQRAIKGSDDETLGVGTVRDIESDRIEQQIAASKRPIIGVLPQGTARSAFGNLNADAYVAAVFNKLTALGAWGPQASAPPIGRVILSGHSGAGGRISEMMAESGTPRLPSALKEVSLFDAINGPGELRIITNWVLQQLDADLAALLSLGSGSGIEAPAQTAYLRKSTRFRAYYTSGSYRERHENLQKSIDDWFSKHAAAFGAGSSFYTQLKDNYRTVPVGHGQHNKIMGRDNRLLDALTTLPATPTVTQSVQPKAGQGLDSAGIAPPSVRETLRRPGTTLDVASRRSMETRFGYDFSNVRVHTDAEAARSASDIHARAYTLANHVVFAPGAYQPHTETGARLLAHELAHVVQQNANAPESVGILRRQVAEQPTARHVDEEAGILPSINFKGFSVFVPAGWIGRHNFEDPTQMRPNVHVFFGAGLAQGTGGNDVSLHGLRGASNLTDWITIAVPGTWKIVNGRVQNLATPFSDTDIADCLRAVGIVSPPASLRVSGHSRGAVSALAFVSKTQHKDILDRVTLLDEFQVGDPGAGNYSGKVEALLKAGIPPDKIRGYETQNPAKKHLAGVDYRRLPHMDAIGAVRLIQDAMSLNPAIATFASTDKVGKARTVKQEVESLKLPTRGSLPSTAAEGVPSLQTWVRDNASAIKAINVPGLVNFINKRNLTGFGDSTDWLPFAAHEFFVQEIAAELYD